MSLRSWISGGAAALLLFTSPLWGLQILREMDCFRVQRVEVSGSALLAAHDVLAVSGIGSAQNVWDDATRWERSLRAHPGIIDVSVTRRLPGTLRIRIQEQRPVAYVAAPVLRPATAAGEIFPLDPARTPVDLPIVLAEWPDSSGRGARAILSELGRLAELDPGLLAEVSEVRAGDTPGALVLTHRLGELVLPGGLTPARLTELRAVLSDLERRLGELPDRQPPRVDARFEDQIVVRLSSSV